MLSSITKTYEKVHQQKKAHLKKKPKKKTMTKITIGENKQHQKYGNTEEEHHSNQMTEGNKDKIKSSNNK